MKTKLHQFKIIIIRLETFSLWERTRCNCQMRKNSLSTLCSWPKRIKINFLFFFCFLFFPPCTWNFCPKPSKSLFSCLKNKTLRLKESPAIIIATVGSQPIRWESLKTQINKQPTESNRLLKWTTTISILLLPYHSAINIIIHVPSLKQQVFFFFCWCAVDEFESSRT